jgi:hypothetical protein
LKDKKENVKIVSFVDNNKEMQEKKFIGEHVYTPENYTRVDFDYLLIASAYDANDIYNQIYKTRTPPPPPHRKNSVIGNIL